MEGSADTWHWVWLVAAVLFAVLEIFTPFLFFMISFAFGAAVAALARVPRRRTRGPVGGVPRRQRRRAPASWSRSDAAWRRRTDDDAEGALRWVGRTAGRLSPIPGGPHATGLVRLERAQWRAGGAPRR